MENRKNTNKSKKVVKIKLEKKAYKIIEKYFNKNILTTDKKTKKKRKLSYSEIANYFLIKGFIAVKNEKSKTENKKKDENFPKTKS